MRSLHLAMITGALVVACGPRTPALSSLRDSSLYVKVDGDSRTLVEAWRECQSAGDTKSLMLPCMQVDEELRRRRLSREYDLYDAKIEEAASSCEKATALARTFASLQGPIALDDGATVPPWSDGELGGLMRIQREYPMSRPSNVITHAVVLLKCGDGASLGSLFDVHATWDTARPSSAPTADDLMDLVARAHARAAHAMRDAGTAPTRLGAVLEHVPRPAPCPASATEVVALMKATRAADRIAGCECTNELSSLRADAERERRRLIASDDATSTTTSGSASTAPDLANAPAGAGLVLLFPLVLGSLSGGRSETRYPVREACKEALPVGSP